ncbi:MAG: altronate dehydratase [Proteobacteria bacterium]|nr:altronate dehydratase [Pseudomonadota bacterium]
MSNSVLLIRDGDSVAIALKDLKVGEEVLGLTIKEEIPFGHKFSTKDIKTGEIVYKYNLPIGKATTDIKAGSWVHTHNITVEGLSGTEYEFSTATPPPPKQISGRTFQGYRREDGRVGTRNYLAVISTVNCSAQASDYVAKHFTPDYLAAKFPNVDGVIAITHQTGCGVVYASEDHEQLERTLAGYAEHPNVSGYLVIGLGCETVQAKPFADKHLVQLGKRSAAQSSSLVMTLQEEGGTKKTVAKAIAAMEELLQEANKLKREAIPVSELVLGLNCGGSDAFSGITANPALGYASDLLVAHGGTAVLAETAEIYGAEGLLTRTAVSRAVGEKLVERIRWWEQYMEMFKPILKNGASLNNNPSPGNKKGGLTTILEKSLGAVAKGGTTALQDVVLFAEKIKTKGFVFMDTPCVDWVSVTGLVAGGCNLMAFTTGRGSCLGLKPTPTLKIATNTPMYQRMEDDMDINAGKILEGASIQQVGEEIFEELIRIASGEKTKSEILGYGDKEFAPWSIGPTL